MFCTHCGKPLAEGARFCTSCGNPIAAAPAAQPAPAPAPVPAPAAPKAAAPAATVYRPSAAPAACKKAAPSKGRGDRWALKLCAGFLGLFAMLAIILPPIVFKVSLETFFYWIAPWTQVAGVIFIILGVFLLFCTLVLLLLGTILSFCLKKVPGLFLAAAILMLGILIPCFGYAFSAWFSLLAIPLTVVATVLGYCARPAYRRNLNKAK
ncbi:MAG: zinc ribbon domain-containing protein [Christensenellaceae bacterium]|nr:zinc ribbon domain-containing protein [Christensenellaceae bacterium]